MVEQLTEKENAFLYDRREKQDWQVSNPVEKKRRKNKQKLPLKN